MFEWIVEHRWSLLITAEVVFWVSTLAFLILRYVFQLHKISYILLAVTLLNEGWIIALGVMDFQQTGRFSTYLIIIVAILIYALTYGKQDAKRLDRFVQRKVLELRGQPVPEALRAWRKEQLYGWAHTKKELKGFALHMLVFVTVQVFFALRYGMTVHLGTLAEMDFSRWGDYPLYGSQIASQISQVWMLILMIDALITFSYVIFPKKR
ncbi:hypothetical protein [Lihuaxuella thermophila]|uniref:hypothetical protein n=1 Tax=Lihuaxuella thermophila TaxID=1173111 RepID=UPI000B7F7990|nr:hypothetical protein [Lihuaxuella thermophila]